MHTPGPWVRDTNVIVDHKLAPTFAIGNFYSEPDHSVAQANARLIAAAPDLLEALKQLLAAYNDTELLPTPLLNIASAAISKAEGQS